MVWQRITKDDIPRAEHSEPIKAEDLSFYDFFGWYDEQDSIEPPSAIHSDHRCFRLLYAFNSLYRDKVHEEIGGGKRRKRSRIDICAICVRRGYMKVRKTDLIKKLHKLDDLIGSKLLDSNLVDHLTTREPRFNYKQTRDKTYNFTFDQKTGEELPLLMEVTGFSLADLVQFCFLVGTEDYPFKHRSPIRTDFDDTLLQYRNRVKNRYLMLLRSAIEYGLEVDDSLREEIIYL